MGRPTLGTPDYKMLTPERILCKKTSSIVYKKSRTRNRYFVTLKETS